MVNMDKYQVIAMATSGVLYTILLVFTIVLIVLKTRYDREINDKYGSDTVPEIDPTDNTIQLVAVKRLKGSNLLGYETESEVQARLAKLTKDEFIKLNIIDYPWSIDEWYNTGISESDIAKRNKYETEMLFAYDSNHKLDSTKSKYLVRTFN